MSNRIALSEKRTRFVQHLIWATSVTLMLRLWMLLIGFLGSRFTHPSTLNGAIYQSTRDLLCKNHFLEQFLHPWYQWDAGWYFKISFWGYAPHDGSTAFAPLYPYILHLMTSWFGICPTIATTFLGIVFTILALWSWLEIGSMYFGEARSKESLYVWITFPTAFFLFAPYTEAVFVAILGWAWLAAQRRQWAIAGILGAMATLARFQGVLFSVVFFWIYLHPEGASASSLLSQLKGIFVQHSTLKVLRKPQVLWGFLPIATFGFWQLYLISQGMESPTQIQHSYWNTPMILPWQRVLNLIGQIAIYHDHFFVSDYLNLIVIFGVIIASIIALKYLPGSFSLYIWGTLCILLMRDTFPYPVTGFSRFTLHIIPLFFLIAYLPKRVARFIQGINLMLQAFFLLIFLSSAWVA